MPTFYDGGEYMRFKAADVFESAFEFFLRDLGIEEFKDKITVRSVKPGTEHLDKNSSGRCYYHFKEGKAEIYLTSTTPSCWGLMEVLAHELVHAKQYLRGESGPKDAYRYSEDGVEKKRWWNPWAKKHTKLREDEASFRQVDMVVRFIKQYDYRYGEMEKEQEERRAT